jgi:hypothetical protein
MFTSAFLALSPSEWQGAWSSLLVVQRYEPVCANYCAAPGSDKSAPGTLLSVPVEPPFALTA